MGKIVLPKVVSLEGGGKVEAHDEAFCRVKGLLEDKGVDFVEEELKTVGRITSGKDSPFRVFDMESYWLLSWAMGKDIPALAIRAVSDSGEELPDFSHFRLRDIPKYFALFLSSNRARRSLGKVLEAIDEGSRNRS